MDAASCARLRKSTRISHLHMYCFVESVDSVLAALVEPLILLGLEVERPRLRPNLVLLLALQAHLEARVDWGGRFWIEFP